MIKNVRRGTIIFYLLGQLAQLVRALHSHCRGRWFESSIVHQGNFMDKETVGNEERQSTWWTTVREFTWELIKVAVFSIAIIIPVRYFLVQPFYVRGASMEPNFLDRDYLVIDEISYGIRVPFADSVIPISKPIRGETIVIRYPNDPRQYFIKRVIGLPGETIFIRNNEITIFDRTHPDGVVLREPYLDDDAIIRGEYTVILASNEYYVLGDNRASSLDSRSFGAVHRSMIVGRAWLRGWPFDRINYLEAPAYDI
jgi:signal peptidase I